MPAKTTAKKTAARKAAPKVTRSKSAAKPAAKAPTAGLTKAQLTRAAKLRGEGATWNAIRAEFGVKHGSSTFFRLWERQGIDHIPAGEHVKAAADAKGGKA